MPDKKKEFMRKEDGKKILSYFILFFPSVLIAIIPETINGNVFISIAIKTLIVFYQFVILKNFVDRFYGD